MNKITDLTGDSHSPWTLYSQEGESLGTGTLPVSVISILKNTGRIKDPYWRNEQWKVLPLLEKDYVLEKRFTLDSISGFFTLLLSGIDTVADVYLNGELLISVRNMHRTYRITETDRGQAISEVLHKGENLLRFTFTSPVTYIHRHRNAPGKEINYVSNGVMPGAMYIRKAQSMFGWDWGIMLPDMGIYGDVKLMESSGADLASVHIRTRLSDPDSSGKCDRADALLSCRVMVHGAGMFRLSAELSDPEGNPVSKSDSVFTGLSEVTGIPQRILDTLSLTSDHELALHADAPKLWWPRGMGDQPLYTVKVSLSALKYKTDGTLMETVLDTSSKQIGFRTLRVSTAADQYGKDFSFVINGKKIFAKGADWIPENAIYPEITEKMTDHLLKSCVLCNFNTIRVWGGGYYPGEHFLSECDRLGIILWQDIMFACHVYELDDELRSEIVPELEDNIRDIADHPCLGLICGNNEMEYAWVNWDGYRDHSELLKEDYLKLFEELIPGELKKLAPDTFYWPSSPSGGGHFKDLDTDSVGDCHFWEVWHGGRPFEEYEKHDFRFCSEFGFQSFPEARTIEAFTLPEDRNIFSPVMEGHQKNGTANEKIMEYISQYFRYPKDFDSLCYVSQVLQALAMKTGVDHWRRNRGKCMGALYWQLNDNWPVASWSSIDFFGRWKATQYFAGRFFQDVSGTAVTEMDDTSEDIHFRNITGLKTLKKPTGAVTLYLSNDTLHHVSSEVTLSVRDIATGKVVSESKACLSCEPLSVSSLRSDEAAEALKGHETSRFLYCRFSHSDGSTSSETFFAVPYKMIEFPDAHVMADYDSGGNTVILNSDAPAFFTEIHGSGEDFIFSDNYVTVLPDEPVRLNILKQGDHWTKSGEVKNLCPEDFKVRSIVESY